MQLQTVWNTEHVTLFSIQDVGLHKWNLCALAFSLCLKAACHHDCHVIKNLKKQSWSEVNSTHKLHLTQVKQEAIVCSSTSSYLC